MERLILATASALEAARVSAHLRLAFPDLSKLASNTITGPNFVTDKPRGRQPMSDLSTIRAALADLYQHGEHSTALAHALGMQPITNPANRARGNGGLPELLSGRIGEFYRVGEVPLGALSAGLYLAYADQWHARSAEREPYRRRIARALVEFAQNDGRWICVLLDGNRQASDAEFIMPKRREGAKAGTIRATVDLKEPTRFHLERIAALNASGASSLAELSRRWNDEFSVDVITRRFHTEFRGLRDRLVTALVESNPANPAVIKRLAELSSGPEPTPVLRDPTLLAFGTRQLGRLLFLWFLQRKRWLGGAPGNGMLTFVADSFTTYTQSSGTDRYFNDVLAPIFFDGLGQSEHQKPHRAIRDRFGPVPFLGGGLFRADDFEAELFGIGKDDDTRALDVLLPDTLFDPAKDNEEDGPRTVLGFLAGYRFTTQESTPDDQSVDPDPELLGKVFENLYQEDERHSTGAYYTPREIVHYMCRQALDGYLRSQTGIGQDTLDWLRSDAIDWSVTGNRLDTATDDALRHALDNVSVLDPAAGSGAFLLGAMQEIVLLRRGLALAQTSGDLDYSSLDVADWKRRAITQSLYGVDINPTAVEICKLRLWLSLVLDLELSEDGKPISLPDLDFRILAGDSLIDRMGAEPFIQSLPDPRQQNWQPRLDIQTKVTSLQHQVDGLKQRFGGEGVTPSEQRNLSRRIRKAELDIAAVQLDGALEGAAGAVAALDERQRKGQRVTATARRAAESHLAALQRLQAGLREDAPFQKPFLWPVNFHDVMERGGFDVVLANPPYVRQESLDGTDQDSYKHSFEHVHAGTADLLVYFYARAVQLLKDGGQLAFITSNKYMRAAYGKGIREFLPTNLQVSEVIDFGDLPLFENVAAYPAVLIGQRSSRPDGDAHLRVADLVYPLRNALADAGQPVNFLNTRTALEDLAALLNAASVHEYPHALLRKDGWVLEDPKLIALFDRLMAQGMPLGEYVQGRMYYGVKTGLNEAFIINQARRDELIVADPKSAEIIKPWLRGKDIKRWTPEWAGLYILAVPNSGDARARNAWAGAATEPEAFEIFRETYPAICDHLAQHERRLRPRSDQGKWWWELRACAYYPEFEQPKVIWPRNVPPTETRFAWDSDHAYINDKAYVLGGLDRSLLGPLNSTLALWMCDALTTKLGGGWLELKSDEVVGRLPIVEPDEATRAALIRAVDERNDAAANSLTAKLYCLTPEDERLIAEWLAKRSLAGPANADDQEEAADDE